MLRTDTCLLDYSHFEWIINQFVCAHKNKMVVLLFDPRGRPTFTVRVITIFTHVRPHFSKLRKTKFSSEYSDRYTLAGLWIWPSGSLMKPVFCSLFQKSMPAIKLTAKADVALSIYVVRIWSTYEVLRSMAEKTIICNRQAIRGSFREIIIIC